MDPPAQLDRCPAMAQIKLSLTLAAALAACSAPAREPDRTPSPSPRETTASARPFSGRLPGGMHDFVGASGLVRLRYTDPLKPSRTFVGGSLMSGGWRLIWDSTPIGPGTKVVSVAQDALPTSGTGIVTEFVQVGMSRDPGVVATCGTAGMGRGIAARQPNRMLGGHRWTVWTAGDAGMMQEIGATDYRTVVDGVCYAVDRVSYAVKATDPKPGLPTQKAAAARIDAVLASIRVGGR